MRLAAAFLSVCVAGPAFAWDSPVPDVVLYCTRPLAPACAALGQAYHASTGIGVHLFQNSATGLAGLVQHRARVDLVLADAATVDGLAAGNFVQGGTARVLGADPFVLVAHDGGGLGDARTLLAAHVLTLPDPTTAASFNAGAVLHAALNGAPAPATIGVPDSPNAAAEVAGSAGALGLVTATDARAAALPVAARLSAPPMLVKAAVVTLRQSRNAANLLAFAAGSQGQAALRAAGLEAAPETDAPASDPAKGAAAPAPGAPTP